MCIYLYTCTPYIANNTHHRIHYICIGTAQYLLPSIPGTCTRVGSYIGRYSDMFYRMCGLTKSRRRELEPSKRSGQARVIYLSISILRCLFFGKCSRKMPGTPAFDLSNLHHNSSPFRDSYGSYAGCCRFPSQGYVHEDCSCRVTVEQP